MTAEHWTRDVRRRLGLGRLLPLGEAGDGAWLAESAARAFLAGAVVSLPDVLLGAVRVGLADPADVAEPVVPPPPSALPPGPLRVTAEFSATAAEPLPVTAQRLRTALATAAREGLGLAVAEVDLRVIALLDETMEPARDTGPAPVDTAGGYGVRAGGDTGGADEALAATAALAVPGVAGLTGSLGGLGRPVHLEERTQDGVALPHRHARVEITVRAGHRPVDVARAVRAAVSQALPDRPTVAVLVTAIS
ncbi:nucleopolyhedrovirus P10 family protein [Streptomyces sp. NPDC028635]|uniref:nucleopolyhedrovirus P10 family protein n=1 Tax=Streptomyces sp. NPDC028635 TaxID=3154800 RepID=UPI0033FA7FC7